MGIAFIFTDSCGKSLWCMFALSHVFVLHCVLCFHHKPNRTQVLLMKITYSVICGSAETEQEPAHKFVY